MKPRTADVEAMNMRGQDASEKKKRVHERVMAEPSEHHDSDRGDWF
jgi:hypothetical protein